MQKPDIPKNEANRLAALQKHEILDSVSEREFDDIAQLASQICAVPIALISLVDENRQWFKSKIGLSEIETSREISFCAHAINSNSLFEVPNTLDDVRFFDNPLVTGELDIRFYAGMPITTADGLNIGTLCVLDQVPKTLTYTQRNAIQSLSRLVMRLIEGRTLGIQKTRFEIQLKRKQEALNALNEITSQFYHIDYKAQLHQALVVGMRYLDFEYGSVSNFAGEIYTIEVQISPQDKFKDGMQMLIKDTFCQLMLDKQETVEIPHISQSPYSGNSCLKLSEFESYLGQLIVFNDQIYSAVSFSSIRPCTRPFNLSEIDFLQMPVRWIRSAIEREQLINTLRQTNERIELALDGASLGLWDWHIPTQTVHYSTRWYEMLGYAPNELNASFNTFEKLLHPEDMLQTLEFLNQYLNSKADEYKIEFRLMHITGRVVWVHSLGRVIERDINGEILRIVGTHMDISERKATQLSIETRYEVVKRAGQIAKVGGWSLDLVRNQLFWSDDVKRIHELDDDYMPDVTSAINFYDSESQAQIREAVAHAIETCESWDLELPFTTAKNKHLWVRFQGDAIIENGQVVRLAGAFQDITRFKIAEDQIKKLAFYDSLTNLPNRRLLLERLVLTVARSKRSKLIGALLFIDLDKFKAVNDTLGHDKGDDLLRQVAVRLLDCVRDTDTVARLGGDEFVVLLESLSDDYNLARKQVLQIGGKIIDYLDKQYYLGLDNFSITPSIGVTLLNGEQDSTELLKNADVVMYQAKADGRNCMRFFDDSI